MDLAAYSPIRACTYMTSLKIQAFCPFRHVHMESLSECRRLKRASHIMAKGKMLIFTYNKYLPVFSLPMCFNEVFSLSAHEKEGDDSR